MVNRWLLPALIARLLIPIGFMPGNLWAGQYMVPCPTSMPAWVFDSRGDVHHVHHSHHQQTADDHRDLLGAERQCPVGLALSGGFMTAPEGGDVAAPQAFNAAIVLEPVARQTSQVRHYLSRAPPPPAFD